MNSRPPGLLLRCYSDSLPSPSVLPWAPDDHVVLYGPLLATAFTYVKFLDVGYLSKTAITHGMNFSASLGI